jgi:hypothetical protein
VAEFVAIEDEFDGQFIIGVGGGDEEPFLFKQFCGLYEGKHKIFLQLVAVLEMDEDISLGLPVLSFVDFGGEVSV